MGQIRLPGNPSLSVALRRSTRARRLSLRVSRLDGRVTLTLPSAVSEAEGRRFVQEKADWIARAVASVPADCPVVVGAVIPVAGKPYRISGDAGRSARLDDGEILAPTTRPGPAIRALLKAEARGRLAAAVDRHAGRLGRPVGRLTLRDTRSRWGSCSYRGDLMFSWRLVMAPPDVLDYVAAHEVAHLVHMDHSAAFWSVVETLRPDWRKQRDWLRREGETLHRYRFDADD